MEKEVEDLVNDAIPSNHFAVPPYEPKLFSEKTGWSGVLNGNGVNCLTFKSKPGATITSFGIAKLIAGKWNADAKTHH